MVLQTYSPENYILRYAVAYDYDGFFKNEVSVRKTTFFPPFSLICRVMVTGGDNDRAVEALREVYEKTEKLREDNPSEFIFSGRMHSPIKKIQGKYRYQVLMRLKSRALLQKIYDIASACSTPAVLVYVEENPANLS